MSAAAIHALRKPIFNLEHDKPPASPGRAMFATYSGCFGLVILMAAFMVFFPAWQYYRIFAPQHFQRKYSDNSLAPLADLDILRNSQNPESHHAEKLQKSKPYLFPLPRSFSLVGECLDMSLRWFNQRISRDTQPLVEILDHLQSQRALVIKDLVNAIVTPSHLY